MDLFETSDPGDLKQNSKQKELQLSFETNEVIEKPGLLNHDVSSVLMLDNSIESHGAVRISSPSNKPPQQLLQDPGPPTPPAIDSGDSVLRSNETDALSGNSIHLPDPSQSNSRGSLPYMSNNETSTPVIQSMFESTENTNPSKNNVSGHDHHLHMLLREHSFWDLIISKISQLDANNLESNDHNLEQLSIRRLELLILEIEQILCRLKSILFNCCSVSPIPEQSQNNGTYILDDKSLYVGEHVSHYLGSTLFNEVESRSETSNFKIKVTIKDSIKFNDEFQGITQQTPSYSTVTRPNHLDEAKLVEELLFKIDPECNDIKHDDWKSKELHSDLSETQKQMNEMHMSKSSDTPENGPSSPRILKLSDQGKLNKCNAKRKTKKSQKRNPVEQQMVGPPPPPIIREDGKRIYRKQKVISGYFSHYPISEEQYIEVINQGEPYTCPPCQREFKHRRSWEHHLNGRCLGMPLTKPNWYKRDGKFFCSHEGCTETASNRGWTTTYMVWVHFYRVHSPGGQLPHKCDLCDKSYAKIAQLRIHKESKHNINRKVSMLCDLCI